MLNLHILQAEFGDCLLLEYGSANQPLFALIDGGPETIFDRHLRPVLKEIGGAGIQLDFVALSHVDTDHAIGLLDYFAELQTAGGEAALPSFGKLWHNSFGRTLDPDGGVQARLKTLITNTRAAVMSNAGMAVNGIAEGNQLRLAAQNLNIPINPGFPGDLVLVDTAPAPIAFGNLTVRITGPTQANLDALRAKWEAWLDEHEGATGSDDPFAMANSDRSVPNLSSVTFLVEGDGKTILFTGDGRSDHLLDGLDQTGLLNESGSLHVDVLKLAHHASNRNTTRNFFKKVTADRYVASANGKDGNPDLATLIWIVEAAQQQQRDIELVVTNRTPSVEQLLDQYPPTDYRYTLRVLPANRHRLTLNLS